MTVVESAQHHPDNPTARWPDPVAAPPNFDWSELRFGPIRFGEPIDRAAPLGRPDDMRRDGHGAWELVYARAGFTIRFEQGRFCHIAHFIAPDATSEMHPVMSYCTPALDDELALTRDVRIEDVKSKLGPPTSVNVNDEETVLVYAGDGIVLEFEFDREGRLKRWNLHPQVETEAA